MQDGSHLESKLRIGLGTFVAIDAEARNAQAARRGIAAAFDAIAVVERLMHPTRAGSDLAALAVCPSGRSLRVHPWTMEVLHLSKRLNEFSDGAFDPCLDLAPGRISDLDLGAGLDVIPRVRMHIDLGGIAKGYAIDRAIEALQASGCSGGLVNAGGDLAVFGERRREITWPTPSGAAALVGLLNAALATSDTGESSPRPVEHRGYYHGSDRRLPVSGRVTVSAPRAAVADAMTKCMLLGERPWTAPLLAEFGATRVQFLECEPQPEIKPGEIAVELKPLIVRLEHHVRRGVEIGPDRPDTVSIDRPVSIVAGVA